MKLTSTAFQHGQAIPRRFTGDGQDISPPLAWEDLPASTRQLALIMEDPDAPRGTFVHWLLYCLDPQTAGLAEGVGIQASPEKPAGARQGTTSFGRTGYGGPAPPAGKPHRYFFRLYALDEALDLPPGLTRQQLAHAIGEHVLDEAELMGLYGRSG